MEVRGQKLSKLSILAKKCTFWTPKIPDVMGNEFLFQIGSGTFKFDNQIDIARRIDIVFGYSVLDKILLSVKY